MPAWHDAASAPATTAPTQVGMAREVGLLPQITFIFFPEEKIKIKKTLKWPQGKENSWVGFKLLNSKQKQKTKNHCKSEAYYLIVKKPQTLLSQSPPSALSPVSFWLFSSTSLCCHHSRRSHELHFICVLAGW